MKYSRAVQVRDRYLEPRDYVTNRDEIPPRSLTMFIEEQSKIASQPRRVARSWQVRLSVQMVSEIASRCAGSTPSSVLISIVQVESGFRPFLVRVNGTHPKTFDLGSAEEAKRLARSLILRGESVDLGLAQINSRNLGPLGLSADSAFDPCSNLAAAGEILSRGYERALAVDHADRPILQMAYSMYNTGSPVRGLANGYASKVEAARQEIR